MHPASSFLSTRQTIFSKTLLFAFSRREHVGKKDASYGPNAVADAYAYKVDPNGCYAKCIITNMYYINLV